MSRQIDKYRLIAELKRGQSVTVYRAYEAACRRFVLLKVLHATEAGVHARFAQEAQILMRLQHRNIVRIYECGQAQMAAGQLLPFLAMEFIEGGTLADVMAGRRLPAELVIYLATEMVAALQAAHACRIVHRDLKPQNLLVDAAGHLKVTDFGLAAFAGGETHGAIIGTPQYMSPEQAAGEAATPASDYFSLGVIMYEMLAGFSPFDGDTISARLYRVRHENPVPLTTLLPEITPQLAGLVQQLLEKNPQQRLCQPPQILQALTHCEHLLGKRARREHFCRFLTDPEHYSPEKIARRSWLMPGKNRQWHMPWRWTAVLAIVIAGGAWQLMRFQTAPEAARHGNGAWPHEVTARPDGNRPADPPATPAQMTGGAKGQQPGSNAAKAVTRQPPEKTEAIVEPPPAIAMPHTNPAPPAASSIRLTCLPFAYAIVDGDTLGTVDMLPALFQVPSGERLLTLANPRFPQLFRRLQLAPAETLALQFSLWETVARLTLHVKPWAEVFIDEVSYGKTPLDEIILAPGEHRLRLEHPERARFVTTRTFAAGQREILSIELQAKE
ncbi:MAG: protein kinase [candidate division KSB1 bacterium]|nr:protein kinase [candidate division KSB1 bacterium]MDZ7274822.1 protein kinase [candidate division KSB1 bacterium]MDZ7285647.1 protein kinase [candidate division KSB1 bacterium]MDZ7298679.1 protein kinase [candidate division KSB1 bacterium]MDZ7308413.1 protein kinase [candidate division KSB1 bacterium]